MIDQRCKIIDLPKVEDQRGNLTFIEEENHIPFPVKRVYWIFDVPGGQVRGGHAFMEQQEFIIALSGSFDVIIDDGEEKKCMVKKSSFAICSRIRTPCRQLQVRFTVKTEGKSAISLLIWFGGRQEQWFVSWQFSIQPEANAS